MSMQICFVNPQPIVGNDHRLGANEAPPAIISVFLGEQLDDVIDTADQHRKCNTQYKGGDNWRPVLRLFRILQKMQQTETEPHRLHLPEINSSSVWLVPRIPSHAPNIVLNTIVAEAFCRSMR